MTCGSLTTLIIILLLVVFAGSLALGADAGANLLSNVTFADTAGKGLPDGWQPLPNGNGATTWLSLVKDDNGNAVKIIDHDGTVGVGVAQRVPCQPGHQYSFSAEMKGGSCYLFLRCYDDKGAIIQPEFSTMTPHSEEWKRATLRITVPAGSATLMAWIYTTTVLMTDVQVRLPDLRDEGAPVKLQGPLTTDKDFFRQLNLTYPGLEEVKAAVEREDYHAATEAYLTFRRTKSRVRWRFDPAQMPTKASATHHPAADRALQHMIAMPWGNDMTPYSVGDPINWLFNPRKTTEPAYTIEWTYIALNRMYFWQDLANAYWATLDEKYAKEWVAELESWIRDNPVPLEAGFGDTVTWRTIEAGIRMSEVWPDVYYHFLLSPSFTPQANLSYAKSVLEHAQRLQRIIRDYPNHGGNWVTMECNGLCTAAMLFPEWKTSADFIAAAFQRMDRELTEQVYPDGGQVELSGGYHQVSMVNFMGMVNIAKMNDVPIPPDYLKKLKAMYSWDLSLMDQDGLMPSVNDETPPTRVTRVLADAAKIWGDAEFTFGATLGKQGVAPPLSSFLPYSGYYAMRSGWDKDDLYLFFDAGPVGMGHWHEDMLNLLLRANGKMLLTEAGGFAYDASKMRHYVLGTTAHNTITVDGKEQHRGTGAPPPMVPTTSRWASSPLYDYAAGTYDAGYQSSEYVARGYFPVQFAGPRDSSITHTRHLFFLKPYCVIAFDVLQGTGTHRYDAYFHLDAPDALIDDTSKSVHTLRADGVQLALIPLEVGDLQVRKVIGQQDPPLGWVAWPNRAIPTIIYTRQAATPAIFSTLLYPYKGEAPKVTCIPLKLNVENCWAAQFDTPREHALLALQLAAEPVSISIPAGIAPAITTDARSVLIRQPAGQPWIGLESVTKLQMPALELTSTIPASIVLAPTPANELFIYNSGAQEVSINLTKPVTQTVLLRPGSWLHITDKGIIPVETAPVFIDNEDK